MPLSAQADRGGEAGGATVALVVPTRNEAHHVEPFIDRVEAALAPFQIDWHAEVIDDSEDDTAALMRGLVNRGAPLEVTQRTDARLGGGPGSAVRYGLSRAHGDILCVIDADLQHPPEILPDLLAPIILGRADISIGSRYRREGSAAGLESPWRRLGARVSGAFVRWFFPTTRLTTDPGSGLFAVRREVLESVALRSRGSRVLAEILVRANWQTVCDIPYRFAASDDGDAQLGATAAFALARELISLRLYPRLAGSRGDRARPLGVGGLRNRRRAAPVNLELLRDSDRAEGSVRSVADPMVT
jgi:dolichol-phosphate mannosyltransferase